ncbi:hypothetical protein [Aeromicrobium sp.]|uniref:hypothetical protein n=1 Tax=Aeromicrobium sp. TaxID=1871063 RepID=UPI004034B36E
MPDPVLMARSRLANAVKDGGDVDAARKALTVAKLEREVRRALDAFPPLDEQTKADVARLLTGGGA